MNVNARPFAKRLEEKGVVVEERKISIFQETETSLRFQAAQQS
jgi:hypothetical protein